MESANARALSSEFKAQLARVRLSADLHVELEDVYAHLLSVATALDYPLDELAFTQIQDAQPLPFASVVLAAGLAEADTPTVRQQRVDLAAALELLSIALGIHALLLTPANAAQLHAHTLQSKGIIGSTILAGDYCFSRSAALAARTDHPAVVAIFAQALKKVSETFLRHVFDEDGRDTSTGATAILIRSGIEAATILSTLPEQETTHTIRFGEMLAQHLHVGYLSGAPNVLRVDSLARFQRARWREIITWCTTAPTPPE